MQFISQDGLIFKVNIIQNQIDDKTLKYFTKINNTNLEIVNLTTINSNILKKVIQYCYIHQDDTCIPQIQRPLKSNKIFDIVEFKDAEFITQFNFDQIFLIIQAAQVLGINTLIDLSCAYIALQIRGKSSDKIKQMLNTNNSKTDEENQKQRDIEKLAKEQRVQILD